MSTGRIEALEARFAIQDLVADYCHGMDKHDLERFMAIWHEDARYLPGEPFGNFHGVAEIRRAVTEAVWPSLPITRHATVNLVVRLDGDRATGLSDVIGSAATPDGTVANVDASYEDVYERRDGVWRIAERKIVIHDFSGLPADWTLTGEVA